MRAILLDTQVFAWALQGRQRVSKVAVREIERAGTVYLSAVSLYEIAQKVRFGKWPDMEPFLDEVLAHTGPDKIAVVDLDASICLRAGILDRMHRDPFDRLIAATAMERGIPVVSSDAAFDGIVSRIW